MRRITKSNCKTNVKTLATKATMFAVPVVMAACSMTALAGGAAGSAAGSVSSVIQMIVQIISGIAGGVFLVMGIIKFLTGYHSGQPNEMHAAIKDLVVGAAFVALATLVGPLMSFIS